MVVAAPGEPTGCAWRVTVRSPAGMISPGRPAGGGALGRTVVSAAAGRSPKAALASATSSPADAYRSPGALAIPRATTSSISCGSSGRRSVTRGGGSEMWA